MLKFKTDFSDVKIEGHWLKRLDGTPVAYLNYVDGTVEVVIVDDPAAKGGKALFMHVFEGQELHTRFEFNMIPRDWELKDELYFDVRLKLPSNFNLDVTPEGYPAWFELQTITEYTSEAPRNLLQGTFITRDRQTLEYFLRISGAWHFPDKPQESVWKEEMQWTPILDRYFNIQQYIKRHETDGIRQFSIDNRLIWNLQGIKTKGDLEELSHISLAKIYGGTFVGDSKKLWIDTIEIHDSVPTPTPPILATVGGIVIGGGIGYVLNRKKPVVPMIVGAVAGGTVGFIIDRLLRS